MAGFDAHDLLDCYARGVFPMADAREDSRVFLIDPERRGVIPLGAFHVPKRLARTVRRQPYEVRIDSAFHDVILACAASGPGRTETWINRPIEGLYLDLHGLGQAHSVECFCEGELVGGLYGVSLGGAFFGESMFSRRRDASKVALVHLVGRLIAGGYRLLDTQFLTKHLAQFGAVEIDRADYHRRLEHALGAPADFYRLGSAGATGGALSAGAAFGSGSTTGAGAAGAAFGGGLTTATFGGGATTSILAGDVSALEGGADLAAGRESGEVAVTGELVLQLIAQTS
jgi:leucyl/phenylalanyl-tRNA--protein transferase